METNSLQIGVFHQYIVEPFSWLIDHFAGWFGGNFGFALIAITILVRLALMPFMINQYRKQQIMRAKMALMQPEIEAIKQKYAASTVEGAQRKQTEETMAVYSKHGYNPLAMGCLPMLLQIPILSGLYYAIRSNPELAHHNFLWFQLGSSDPVMPFLAAGVYLVQALVMKAAQPPMNGPKGMGWIVYLSPVMMGIFSFSAPAALPLYWCVGGTIMILQTLLSKRLYPMPASSEAVSGSHVA
ncbi:membrane protein insertase YidC [Paenibacillus rhizovicinus]|uniref:Membrane protein insertase YidC n=1 Tax=Paenibacillus rhizovicinus TaxID=2704463 RepID=A0A6C0P3K0_9BACL|nr:membrane protein insertase YidC [Paenibacillus rhizovicinus]QHW32846.1 membrane protein insertase YidC [Paenibacillus rhizovicinus]